MKWARPKMAKTGAFCVSAMDLLSIVDSAPKKYCAIAVGGPPDIADKGKLMQRRFGEEDRGVVEN